MTHADAGGLPVNRNAGAMRAALALVLALAGFVPGAARADDSAARRWLDKMMKATETLNFDGTFVYHSSNWMQTMRIIHRAGVDGGRERLVSLTGAPREVLRDRNKVTCILPSDHAVVVAETHPSTLTRGPIFSAEAGFSKFYELSTSPGDRVAGRMTQRVTVMPRDGYRYGYDLFVDRRDGLLLKSSLLTPRGRAIEQIEYTSISTPATIPDKLLKPGISGKDYVWYTTTGAKQPTNDSRQHWKVGWLPKGFTMTDRERDPLPPSRMPVEHMVYTDGLASLSVYIERLGHAAEPLNGLSHMGAVNAYGRMIDHYQVTVVGEVPERTVEAVAKSITRS